MRNRRFATGLWLATLLALAGLFVGACSDDKDLILATTTSTENSGLLDVLVPMFEDASGYNVAVIAVGSGAAMEMGERGDADVLLVHSPAAEEAFVAAGFGIERARVMFNDFVIVGPVEDPASIAGTTAAAAFAAIAQTGAAFVSRGDDSGTHAKERTLWAAANIEVPVAEGWYAESGQGMGATLTIAAETRAYTLTDRATWLAVAGLEGLPILVEGDAALFNVYHVIVVNPDKHDGLNTAGARAFRAFLLEPETQAVISAFGVEEYGQPLFTGYLE
ncbi:MAG: substrate-binding domain-containing protein [Chloroflexi bacterium]|nr:substrate-binding domain-containing protein [Chloroflexota bacterium]MDA1148120.1 substrate-binding domain-containing protein [Chloroflexota bacterium]